MTPIKFKGYGAGSRDIEIIAEKIVCWSAIDYNGDHGTEIYLDNGKNVRVGEWSSDVRKKLLEAIKK